MSTLTQYFTKIFQGSGPALPVSLGDVYLNQDLNRDFSWVWDRIGALALDINGGVAFLMSGGGVTQAGDVSHVNIAAAVGYAPYTVTLGIDGNNPPTSGNEDITAVRIASAVQSSLALTGVNTGTVYENGVAVGQIVTGATLNGVAVNYVKIEYAENPNLTRTRLRAGGSYNFTVQPTYRLTIDSTAPTAYQVVLATLIGDGSTFLTITQAGKVVPLPLGQERYTPTAGYTPALGDVVELNYNGTIRKAKRIGSGGVIASGSTVVNFRVAKLDATHFCVLYSVALAIYAQVWSVNLATLAVSSVAAAQLVYTCTTTLASSDICNIDGTHCLVAFNTTGGGYNQGYVLVLTCNVNTGSISVGGTVSCGAASSNMALYPVPGSSNIVLAYLTSATTVATVVISGGTSPVFNTPSGTSTVPTAGNASYSSPLGMSVSLAADLVLVITTASAAGSAPTVSSFTLSGTTVTYSSVVSPGYSSTQTVMLHFVEEGPAGCWMISAGYSGTTMSYVGVSPWVRKNNGSDSQYGCPLPKYILHVSALGTFIAKPVDKANGVFVLVSYASADPTSGNSDVRAVIIRRHGGQAGAWTFEMDVGDPVFYATGAGGATNGYCGADTLSSGIVIFGYGMGVASNSYVFAMRRRNTILGVAVDTVGTVQCSGLLSGLSGLTIGPVGVDDNGNLTSVVGEAKVGQALSATMLNLQPIPGI